MRVETDVHEGLRRESMQIYRGAVHAYRAARVTLLRQELEAESVEEVRQALRDCGIGGSDSGVRGGDVPLQLWDGE